jgi:hypothetical protein
VWVAGLVSGKTSDATDKRRDELQGFDGQCEGEPQETGGMHRPRSRRKTGYLDSVMGGMAGALNFGGAFPIGLGAFGDAAALGA